MSSSTVSITANPTGASLRRPTEKKTGSDGIDASPASGGDTSKEKDLSRSIKQGTETTVLERSRDIVQKINNQLPTTSTTTKLRKRTVARKVTSKPAWKTAVSVIVKNLGILVILLLLAQMIRRLAFNQGSGFDSVLNPGLANSDHERRIAEVEKFLKTTTKMMQVQVEVVDRKIENEIAG